MYADDAQDSPKTDDTESRDPDKELEIPEGLAEAFPAMVQDAISYIEEAHEDDQVRLTELYKGEIPEVTQQDLDDGRSDIVSRDVHDAVAAAMPDLVRCFLGDDRVIEFMPGGKDDDQHAEQATDAIRHIFLKENDAFRFIHGSLKDGLVRRFAVATWWHEVEDVSTTRDYHVDPDVYAQLLQKEGTTVVASKVEEPEDPQSGEGPMVTATLKTERTRHKFCVELVPPEELIVSRRARDVRGRHLVGRRQNLPVIELVGMGYDEEMVREHIGGDESIRTSQMAQERQPEAQSGPDENEEEDVLYVETYVEWPHEERMQLFKVCALGTAHHIVACEPVDCVDMALWTPDPEPHTAIGEGWAEKVEDIQTLKTGVWRGVIDSLSEALVPRTEVVEGAVNIDDAMSTEIGGLVRVRVANSVRPISTPFVGQQAMPLLEAIDHMREERVGAFRAADGLSAESMQSSTKIAVAATISGSKAQKELLAYGYAWMFLRPIFRGLLRLFVENQDKPKWIRMRGEWAQVDPQGWNADMDCTVDVALAMSTVEERVTFLQGVAEKQELIIQTLGPQNPLANLGHYAHTLRSLVALGGYRNKDAFFGNLPTDPQALAKLMPQAPQQPDPALLLAQAQIDALGQDQARKDSDSAAKRELEERRFKADDDFRRDELDQDREIRLAEIAAKFSYDTQAHEADIEADINKNRDGLTVQAAQHALDVAAQPQTPPAGEGAQEPQA